MPAPHSHGDYPVLPGRPRDGRRPLHAGLGLRLGLARPLLFRGSASLARDPGRPDGQNDFPLYVKKGGGGAEAARIDYALFILNKDLAQLRWHCGLITTDLKRTLGNLAGLVTLAADDGSGDAKATNNYVLHGSEGDKKRKRKNGEGEEEEKEKEEKEKEEKKI